ncbi:MAG: Flp pilus assembly protein CpaB [Marinosulfonomonas sp.]
MRNVFYFLAALLAFGAAWYYYQDVSEQTATITKLRFKAEDGVIIKAGTVIDDDFIKEHIVSQKLPLSLASEFGWALDDSQSTRINLRDRVLGQDVSAGAFLQRAHFFVAQQEAFARRIKDGYRAFSIPVESNRAVENFITPGSHVDVIGTFEIAPDTMVSKRLLENVEVMAVGEIDSRGEYEKQDRPAYNSVTLQAKAEAMEAYLAEAENVEGSLTLVLRNPCEDSDDCVGAEVAQ